MYKNWKNILYYSAIMLLKLSADQASVLNILSKLSVSTLSCEICRSMVAMSLTMNVRVCSDCSRFASQSVISRNASINDLGGVFCNAFISILCLSSTATHIQIVIQPTCNARGVLKFKQLCCIDSFIHSFIITSFVRSYQLQLTKKKYGATLSFHFIY